MKKLLAILLISGVFISCKKDSATTTTPTPNPTAARSFTCTINGAAFSADSAWYNNFNAGGTNIFAVKGSGATAQLFEINLTGTTATTYAFPPHAFTYATTTNYNATAGSLNVSTYDATNRKISGSFTGITAGAFTITNGAFANLPYK